MNNKINLSKNNGFINKIALHNFRCHKLFEYEFGNNNILFTGDNGAGKTAILEAISLFTSGSGLRAKSIGEVISNDSEHLDETTVFINYENVGCTDNVSYQIAKGDRHKKIGRRNGADIKSNLSFQEVFHPIWLTPAQDGIFTGPANVRRRYFDRLIAPHDGEFLYQLNKYERLMRQRNKILANGSIEDEYLLSLESEMACAAIIIASHRVQSARNLSLAPSFSLERGAIKLEGTLEVALLNGEKYTALQDMYQSLLHENRQKDQITGTTNIGPHKTTFQLINQKLNRDASNCSTGEQKILLLDLFMANAYIISQKINSLVLLLDDISAHLDNIHINILTNLIDELGFQTIISSTNEKSFADWQNKLIYSLNK